MSVLLLLGAVTACSDASSKTDNPNSEQTDEGSLNDGTQDNGSQQDDNSTQDDGSQQDDNSGQ